MLDVIIIGAGPIGLEAAIRATRAGLSYLVLEKGAIVQAMVNYPTYMLFFTTSERLEIGGHPLVTSIDKPTRKEALDYYRKVVHNERLEVETFHEVTQVKRLAEGFEVLAQNDQGQPVSFKSRFVALATGYFDNPKYLGIPGEDLPNVSHYYSEAHPFYGRDVTIIGAGSSAADAALDLFKAGANVTMVHRGDSFRFSLKYWIKPNLENRVKEGSIKVHFNSIVREIRSDAVIIEKRLEDGNVEELTLPTDQTFALTGYYASTKLLEHVGVLIKPEDGSAQLSEETFETNVPGFFVIGSAGYGTRTSDVFIENGLVHAEKAVAEMVRRLERSPALV
jgi:thioredoxin reductase (NADPH)